jgi:ribosome modulation factor
VDTLESLRATFVGEGYAAFKAGTEYEACPYEDVFARASWRLGWETAEWDNYGYDMEVPYYDAY